MLFFGVCFFCGLRTCTTFLKHPFNIELHRWAWKPRSQGLWALELSPLKYPLPSFTHHPLPLVSSQRVSTNKLFFDRLSVLIQFETSGEWPDDLEAIQRIKAAFLLNIASILKNDHRLSAVAATQHVDVLKVSIFSGFFCGVGHHGQGVLMIVRWAFIQIHIVINTPARTLQGE